MKEQEILRIYYDKDGNMQVDCPNMDDAVIAISNHIAVSINRKDLKGLNVLFAIVLHLLAMDTSGNMEKMFLQNLKEKLPKYRANYIEMARAMNSGDLKPKS